MKTVLIKLGAGIVVATALVLILTSTVFAAPEESVPETSIPEECVPEGFPIIEYPTGETYIHDWNLTTIGEDSCGNDIPDICVEWPDGGFTRLWSLSLCGPDAEESERLYAESISSTTSTPSSEANPSTTPEEQPMMLPETGDNTWVLVGLALFLIASGMSLGWFVRKGDQTND